MLLSMDVARRDEVSSSTIAPQATHSRYTKTPPTFLTKSSEAMTSPWTPTCVLSTTKIWHFCQPAGTLTCGKKPQSGQIRK